MFYLTTLAESEHGEEEVKAQLTDNIPEAYLDKVTDDPCPASEFRGACNKKGKSRHTIDLPLPNAHGQYP